MADTLTFSAPVEWSKSAAYEQNIIVFVGKRAYTSLKAVPSGIEITDTSYWAETGVPDTTQLKADIETLKGNVSMLQSDLSTTNSNVTANNNAITSIRQDINNTVVPTAVKATPSVSDLQIKKNYVFDSVVTHANKYINNFTGLTIENYESNLETSSVQTLTEPIRVRDIYDGSLVYNNLHLEGKGSYYRAVAMTTFDRDGNYLRLVRGDDIQSRTEKFLADEYFAILSEYSSFPYLRWAVDDVEIEWLNPSHKRSGTAYTVGPNGDWQTFTDMLIALESDTTEKTIYVAGGVYDIFEEMGGADYIASISDPSSLNWRDVCHVVPPNTTIIGVGDVTLQWLPESSVIGSQEMAFLFSPLNVSGSCHIENITVKVKNGRYAIHDETSGNAAYDGATRVFKNVRAIRETGGTYGQAYAYGAGHNKNMRFTFEDCYFESLAYTCFSMHDWPAGVNEASTFTFNNCIFKVRDDDTFLLFISSDHVGRLDKVRLNGCACTGVRYAANNTTDAVLQGYEFTAVGCHELSSSVADNVTVDKPMKQYLTIPSA